MYPPRIKALPERESVCRRTPREIQKANCPRRKSDGWFFGHGFDSRQVHHEKTRTERAFFVADHERSAALRNFFVFFFIFLFHFQTVCDIIDKNGPVAQLGERCVRNAQVKGSSPSGSTIKETSFVYHGKRRFFSLYGQKYEKNRHFRAFRRWISRPEAQFFCFQDAKSVGKGAALSTFLYTAKKSKKVEL